MLARGVNHKWEACPRKGSTQAPVHPHQIIKVTNVNHMSVMKTSLTIIPMCPWERVPSTVGEQIIVEQLTELSIVMRISRHDHVYRHHVRDK